MRPKNTAPELALQAALRNANVEFTTHAKDLPGTPDLYLQNARLVVFVHGCYWHRHAECQTKSPSRPTPFAQRQKSVAAVRRDVQIHQALTKLNIRVYIAWELHIAKSPRAGAREIRSITQSH